MWEEPGSLRGEAARGLGARRSGPGVDAELLERAHDAAHAEYVESWTRAASSASRRPSSTCSAAWTARSMRTRRPALVKASARVAGGPPSIRATASQECLEALRPPGCCDRDRLRHRPDAFDGRAGAARPRRAARTTSTACRSRTRWATTSRTRRSSSTPGRSRRRSAGAGGARRRPAADGCRRRDRDGDDGRSVQRRLRGRVAGAPGGGDRDRRPGASCPSGSAFGAH